VFEFRQKQENFSLLQNAQPGSGTHPVSYSVGTGFFLAAKTAEEPKQNDHLPAPPGAEVNDEIAILLFPLIRFHG
jgi:hypothetical protein